MDRQLENRLGDNIISSSIASKFGYGVVMSSEKNNLMVGRGGCGDISLDSKRSNLMVGRHDCISPDVVSKFGYAPINQSSKKNVLMAHDFCISSEESSTPQKLPVKYIVSSDGF